MKKILSITALTAMLAAGTATAALAGEPQSYVGIDIAYANENIQNRESLQKFTGGVSLDFDDSVAFQVRYGRRIDAISTFELMVDYVKFQEDDATPGIEDDFEVLNFVFNSKLKCPRWQMPYLIAGIGIMNAYEDITAAGASSTTSEWGLSSRIGVGIDYPVNDTWSLNLEAARTVGIGGLAKVRYSTVSLGVRYHF